MKTEKLTFLLLSLVTLNGCIESTALLGPAISVGASGNVYQASLSYASNKIVYDSTGKTPMEHVTTFLDPTDEFEGDTKPILMNTIEDIKEILKKPLENLASKKKKKSEPILGSSLEDQFILF